MADYAKPDKKPSKDELAKIHARALKQFAAGQEANRVNAQAALDDLKFMAGEQWDEKSRAERESDGRPCLVINRMPQFVRQVTGDLRQNKPAIKVRPVEDADVGLAEIYTGLIRSIEQTSDADTAYITAVTHAATAGMGHFRVNVDYSDEMTLNQEIRIETIYNPFAVVWDALAQKIDRTDADHCFVIDRMTREAFKARWPDSAINSFDGASLVATEEQIGWWDDNKVRVAEYWVRKKTKRKIGLFDGGLVLDLESDEAKALKQNKIEPINERENEEVTICQYIISGTEVLEPPSEWAGKYLPIVPVIGEEVHIGERVVRSGLIRGAKDAQRLFNFSRSASAEAMAQAPKSPWLVTLDMIKGVKGWWDNAGKKNYPYLPYSPDARAAGGKPERIQNASPAIGMMEEANLAADDMKAVTGIYDAALGQRSNETSGRAINARQREGDTGTYVYADNLSKAIAQGGRIIVDLLPKIYDTERIIRTLGEDGEEAAYIINRMQMGADGQSEQRVAVPMDEKERANKPSILMSDDAKYDIVVTTGPSYATKRMEAADSMIAFVQAVPQAGAVAADLIAKNMDWPGADAIAKRLKKALPPGIDDDGPAQPPAPDPKAISDAMKNIATAEKTKAETEGVQLDNAAKQINVAMMMPEIQAAVRQAIAQEMLAMFSPPDANGNLPPGPMPDMPAPGPVPPMPQQPAQPAGFSMPGPTE